MRKSEIANQKTRRQALSKSIRQIAEALGVNEGFPDDARRATTPNVIDCMGLTREKLGDECFKDELRERRKWCEENCVEVHEIEPIRQSGQLIGRRFRFEDVTEAVHFKLRFDCNL